MQRLQVAASLAFLRQSLHTGNLIDIKDRILNFPKLGRQLIGYFDRYKHYSPRFCDY